ncbi:hypothetical protein C8J43_103245 [Sphingomonas sp. PP-CE-1G-424]|nr:hypothetical protein C8J43_103245 [Sphingomonas sp. PP-CE-1G-424]
MPTTSALVPVAWSNSVSPLWEQPSLCLSFSADGVAFRHP